jgi:hypothetical protein
VEIERYKLEKLVKGDNEEAINNISGREEKDFTKQGEVKLNKYPVIAIK